MPFFFLSLRKDGKPILVVSLNSFVAVQILSFLIRHGDRFLHWNFVSVLLNDLFGIQARGGCMCAGPYGHKLLNIPPAAAKVGVVVVCLFVCIFFLSYPIAFVTFSCWKTNYWQKMNSSGQDGFVCHCHTTGHPRSLTLCCKRFILLPSMDGSYYRCTHSGATLVG